MTKLERTKKFLALGPFTAGALSGLAAYSLIQDYYGMERWVQHCQENWISGYYTVPIALVCVVWGHWSYLRYKSKDKK